MSKQMKRRRLVLLVILIFTIFTGAFFAVRQLDVPYVGFEAAKLSAVWRGEGYETIQSYSTVSSMVRRAKFDHFLTPIEGLPGGIIFEEARSKGDEVYLLFRPANVSDTVVVYCGNRHSHKLLWKRVLGFDA